jgi:HEPN domain-containing protein
LSENELVKKRLEALEGARVALERGLYWVSCFMAYQAVELYVKGLLLTRAGAYPFTYNLLTLISMLSNNPPNEVVEAVRFLNPHYVASRYSSRDMYGRGDAEECVRRAEVVIKWLRNL